MKYAFIVLIAIYLVTYGCSSDQSEKASHETTAPAAVEKSPQSEKVTAPAHQQEPATDQHEHQTAAVEQEPATDQHEHQTAAVEQEPDTQAAESEQVVMPCGRTMAKTDVPENAPCLGMQEQTVPDNGQELSPAMQRMVETTNGVIVATRQLVAATHEMLSAGKEIAEEIVEQGAEQSAAGQEPEAAPEVEVVETMQQFITSAREVIDATNRAIYSVLEEKQQ